MYIPDQQKNTGSYIANTSIFDVGRLQEVNVNSPEFKELLVRLYQSVNNIALVLNTKETGYFLQEEFVTGALFYNTADSSQLMLRPEFRKGYDTGTIAPGATNIPHGLTIGATWMFTHIYGTLTDNGGNNYYPIPWVDATTPGNSIQLNVDATNIVITNNTAITFNSGLVVLEFLKQ